MRSILEACRRLDQILRDKGEIYIRCAGNYGRQLYYELSEMGIHVTAFLDCNYDRRNVSSGVPILHPETVYGKRSGTYFVIIAVKEDSVFESICDEFAQNGMRKGLDFSDSFLDGERRMKTFMDIPPQFDDWKKFNGVVVDRTNEMGELDLPFVSDVPDTCNLIPNLDVPLTTYCSLNCKFCSHCIPYAKPPKHYESAAIADALDQLLSVSYVACLAIMGGEPFVYPELTDFIRRYKALHNFHNIGFTRIVTNGTVVPSREFFEEYKSVPNAYVYISNYGEKSKKIQELIDVCDEFGIKTYVCPYESDWLSLGDVMPRRDYGEKEIRHLYAVCGSHGCIQLLNGRVYACGRVPVLNEYGVIPFSETDFCDVSGEHATLRERLHAYLYEKDYLDGCQYCDGQHEYSRKIRRGK